MAEEKTFEQTLREEFANVPAPQLTVLNEVEYSDDKLFKEPVYNSTDITLTDAQERAVLKLFEEQIDQGFDRPDAAEIVFLCAMHLKDPATQNNLLAKFVGQNQVNFSKDSLVFDTTDEGKLPSLAGRSVDEIPESELLKGFVTPNTENLSAKAAASKIKMKKNEYIKTSRELLRNAEKAAHVLERNTIGEGNDEFFFFLAAYLMKLINKTAQNAVLGLENFKSRFMTFYPKRAVPNVLPKIKQEHLDKLAVRLRADKVLINTWLLTIAQHETNNREQAATSGLLRYVACMQFSYGAMHGYSLFREALIASQWDVADLMIMLFTSATGKAIRTIKVILEKFESITHPNGKAETRSTYFKYARLINPQYFLQLQPTQCLSLIYLEGRIINHFSEHTSVANPLNIFVLSRLGNDQKLYLELMVGAMIGKQSGDSSKKTAIELEAGRLYAEHKNKVVKVEKSHETEDEKKRNIKARMRQKATEMLLQNQE